MNTVGIIGRTTKDIEVMTTNNGKKFVSFCIAVNKGNTKDTAFIDCVAWGNQAEFMGRNVTKGTQIAITGELDSHTYTDRNGVNRKVTEILVHKIDLLWKKKEPEQEPDGLPITIPEPQEETPPTFVDPKPIETIDDALLADLPFEV